MAVTGMIYILSGYQAIQGSLTLGALAAIGGYIYQFMSAASQLLSQWHNLQPGFIAAERLKPLLQAGAAVPEKNAIIASGAIRINQVYFSYGNGPVIFNGINLDIPAAEHTVVTGPSGCGKTTLLNLILRLYPVKSGEILIGGKNGKDIIICPQEPMLWNSSIMENILYPDTRLDQDTIQKAARISGVEEFAARLEKGYDTVIGENACLLSQGQKQRISLARALAKKPQILLLDEAFSGLPEDEEAKIMASIRLQFKAMTIVAVTHRLSSLKDCGNIIRLNA
jgi:ABC-type multidrug transport system fused ATPase/permease subunit